MADATLGDALTVTRDRVLALATFAIPDASGAYAFADNRGTLGRYFEWLLNGYRMERETQTSQVWTFNAELRFKVDEFLADFRGQVQEQAQYTYLPMAAQIFEQYRGLSGFGDAVQRPPFLDPANSGVVGTNARVLIVDDAQMIIFPFVLVYRTTFPRIGL